MTEREDLGFGCVAGSAPKLGGEIEATRWGVGRVLVVGVLQQSKGLRGYTPERSEKSLESRKEPSGGWRGPTRNGEGKGKGPADQHARRYPKSEVVRAPGGGGCEVRLRQKGDKRRRGKEGGGEGRVEERIAPKDRYSVLRIVTGVLCMEQVRYDVVMGMGLMGRKLRGRKRSGRV
jgi:hypothetical protein